MPAIQPARLKKQAVDLAAQFDNPPAFVRGLHALLDHYTDHTHRSGQAGEPIPLTSAYKTSPPVMRQVWLELTRQTSLHPESILPLCDALWTEPNYDLQLLAARLLGQVTTNPPEPVLDRVRYWVRMGLDKRLLDGLLIYGLEQMRKHKPALVFTMISDWLHSSSVALQQAGLHALLTLSNYSGLENLPDVLKLFTPYLRIAPSPLKPDIVDVLSVLARTSPSEIAYLLRQNLNAPDNPDTAWLIRQVLDEFPEETRTVLRAAMKKSLK